MFSLAFFLDICLSLFPCLPAQFYNYDDDCLLSSATTATTLQLHLFDTTEAYVLFQLALGSLTGHGGVHEEDSEEKNIKLEGVIMARGKGGYIYQGTHITEWMELRYIHYTVDGCTFSGTAWAGSLRMCFVR